MDQHTKRAIAYIAGRLLSKKNFFSNYDLGVGCFINGKCNLNSFSLYHHKNQNYIILNIDGNNFNGYMKLRRSIATTLMKDSIYNRESKQ
jgi:hypothetical protein